MASYQEIDSRLRTVEDLLLFIANSMRMRAQVPATIIGADPQVIDANLLDLYRLSRQMPTVAQSDIAADVTKDAAQLADSL
jgi:hypothetical protein